jgi:predicted nuclease of predicted toxin-antitoxin system
MKILADMNMSPRWPAVFIEAGFDAVHWSQLGLAFAPDIEIMAFAKANGYVIFTNDLDFSAILADTNAQGPSVVQMRKGNLRPEAIGVQVIQALHLVREKLDEGSLVTIDPSRTRVRVLPLRARD